MKVVFLGVNAVGLQVYEWLCEREDADVRALLTEPSQLGLVEREPPDLIVSVGFDHLVPESILRIPSEGAINLHPALLPHNRGKSPNVWPLVDGSPAGVTLHYMDPEFDTGDVIDQRVVETQFTDTGKDLHQRLETAQFELFTEVWPDIARGDVSATPQDENAGSYHSTQDFRDLCEMDPDEEVRIREFLNRLRALTFPPFDNAYLELDGERYYVDVDIYRPSNDDTREGLISSY